MYSYLRNGKNGLIHALLSPGKVTTKINNKAVTIDCQTDYPFNTSLSYTIDTETPFDFYIRVPKWSTGIKINNAPAPIDTKTGLTKISIKSGNTTLNFDIGMEIRTESRANDTIAVYRGPILYSLHIDPIITSSPPHYYDTQQEWAEGSYPPQMQDHSMTNGTEWNVAIDPSTLRFHSGNGSLPSPTFDDGKLPMYVTAKACLIDWPLYKGAVPASPPALGARVCIGDHFAATLRPYGSSKLHMSDLPVIELGN
jgi:hypothetical protein